MNLHEAARFLDVSEDTLRRWVRQGLLHPTGLAGGFERGELQAWARERGLSIGRAAPQTSTPPDDLLAAAVERGAVSCGAHAKSAAEAIEVAIRALADLPEERVDELREQVLERERMASTALGHGVAIPHPRKIPARLFREPHVSAVFLESPIDWAALDGEPVHSVFLLLSPTAPVHLEILSRVAFAVRSPEFPAFLHTQPTREELVERLRSMHRGGG